MNKGNKVNRWVLIALIMLGALLAAKWVWKRLDSGVNVSGTAASSKDESGSGTKGGQEGGAKSSNTANSVRGGPASVEVAKPARIALRDTTQAVGTVKARQSVMLRPEASGKITAIGFQDGAYVKKGQLLFQLDDAVPRANLRQAQAQLSIASANYKRNQELVGQGFISQAALEQQSANLQVAQGQYALAQAQMARLRVLAPFGGRVGIRKVNKGDYVREGADLLILEDTGLLHVDFRLPERLQARVLTGQSVQVTWDGMSGQASTLKGEPSLSFPARVTAVEPSVDESARSLLVRASLLGAAPELRPGMFVRVVLTLAQKDNALVVPEEAIVIQQGKQSVWTVVQDGVLKDKEGKERPKMVAKAQPVVLGLRSAGQVEVLEGFSGEETIVVAGGQRLQRNGAPVRIVQPNRTQMGEKTKAMGAGLGEGNEGQTKKPMPNGSDVKKSAVPAGKVGGN